MITRERLKSILKYDPLTGHFTRLVKRGRYQIGEIAGTPDKDGYVIVTVDYVLYKGHRLAWFYMTGVWPSDKIDHKDLNKSNNVWLNIREATEFENKHNRTKYANNTSGYKGVYFIKSTGRWSAKIRVRGVLLHLGYFDTPEIAHEVYKTAAEIYHKAFANFGTT